MLTREEIELLTRVGPGTPMGQVMRQYWAPVLLSSELAPGGRVKRVKLLGEDLVAFRSARGQVGLLGEFCSHRRASLYFGRNEAGGVRCVYHGWQFALDGRCVDMPNEPLDGNFQEKVRHPTYPCNDYWIDRQAQQTRRFFGVPGVGAQDKAITESQRPIYDRTQERLGRADIGIIRVRKCLLDTVLALRDHGTPPPGLEAVSFRIRPASVLLPKDVAWVEGAKAQLVARAAYAAAP